MSDPSGTLSPFNKLNINHDPFGIVGIHSNLIQRKVYVKLAKQFTKAKFGTVVNYLTDIKRMVNPDFMGMETNNHGKDILKLFKSKYNLSYLHGVSNSANLTDETRNKGYTMDKPFMINWFAQQKSEHNILFTDSPTSDMQLLIDQIPQIVSLKTQTGLTTHKATRGRHDDLFLALLLCCHIYLQYQRRFDELR